MPPNTQLKLGEKPTCQQRIGETMHWISRKSAPLGNPGAIAVLTSAAWRDNIDALNDASLAGDMAGVERIGREMMRGIDAVLKEMAG